MTKLTLSVEPTVVKRAKRLAEANKTSVSAMFTQFVQSMSPPQSRRGRIGPLTRKLTGVVKLPRGKSDRELLADALRDKYGDVK
jgi:hypothetical protein